MRCRFNEKIGEVVMVIMKALTCLTLTEEEFHDELAKYLDTLNANALMEPYRLIYGRTLSLLLPMYISEEKYAYLKEHTVTFQQIKDFGVRIGKGE